MKKVQIRPIRNNHELESCYDLWEKVFPNDRDFFKRRLELDETYDLNSTWVAIVDQKLVSAVQVFSFTIWVDHTPFTVSGIGNVATLEEYRGLGYARQILLQISKLMEYRHDDFSLLLTNKFSFYEQMGWQHYSEPIWIVERDRLLQALSDQLTKYHVRPFTNKDLSSVMEIYVEFNTHRTGTRIRIKTYWKGLVQWSNDQFLVMEDDQHMIAYAIFSSINSTTIEIKEIIYKNKRSESAYMLLIALLLDFPNVQRIMSRIPDDHALTRVFHNAKGHKDEFNGLMWKIIDFNKLMKKLNPIFSKRMVEFGISAETTLLWQLAQQDILITINQTGLKIEKANGIIAYDERITTSTRDFIQLLLRGATKMDNPKFKANPLLQILFPESHGFFWSTDFF